jgi:hypothetical protein
MKVRETFRIWVLAFGLTTLQFAGCGGGGGGGPAFEKLDIVATVPADGAVLTTVPLEVSVTFDTAIDGQTLPVDAITVVSEVGTRLVGTVDLAEGDGRTVVLRFAPNQAPQPGAAYEMCVSAEIEAVDGGVAGPMCITFRVAYPGAATLVAGEVRTVSDESGLLFTDLVRAGNDGFALLHRHAVDEPGAWQGAWLDAGAAAWFLGPDMEDTGDWLAQLVVDGAGVLHGRGEFGPVLSLDRYGELARELLPRGSLLRTTDGAVDMWPELVLDGGIASNRYDATVHTWRPSTAVDSYGLEAFDHAPAPNGRLHHGRVEAGPLGTLRIVIEERARSGRVMATSIVETGVTLAGPIDMNLLQLHAGADGRALAVMQTLRFDEAEPMGGRDLLGVVAYEPGLGWGPFEVLATAEQGLHYGYRVDVQFAGPRAVLFCPDALDLGMEIHVRDLAGSWRRERVEGARVILAATIGAIDHEGNILYFTSSGPVADFELHGRTAAGGWSAPTTLVDLGVLEDVPHFAGGCELMPLGNGRFLLVHSHQGLFAPMARLESCVVEVR